MSNMDGYRCSVEGCPSQIRDGARDDLPWFNLPEDDNTLKLWISAARLNSLVPSLNEIRLCSLHFRPDDFEIRPSFEKEKRLKTSVIPSCFPWSSDFDENTHSSSQETSVVGDTHEACKQPIKMDDVELDTHSAITLNNVDQSSENGYVNDVLQITENVLENFEDSDNSKDVLQSAEDCDLKKKLIQGTEDKGFKDVLQSTLLNIESNCGKSNSICAELSEVDIFKCANRNGDLKDLTQNSKIHSATDITVPSTAKDIQCIEGNHDPIAAVEKVEHTFQLIEKDGSSLSKIQGNGDCYKIYSSGNSRCDNEKLREDTRNGFEDVIKVANDESYTTKSNQCSKSTTATDERDKEGTTEDTVVKDTEKCDKPEFMKVTEGDNKDEAMEVDAGNGKDESIENTERNSKDEVIEVTERNSKDEVIEVTERNSKDEVIEVTEEEKNEAVEVPEEKKNEAVEITEEKKNEAVEVTEEQNEVVEVTKEAVKRDNTVNDSELYNNNDKTPLSPNHGNECKTHTSNHVQDYKYSSGNTDYDYTMIQENGECIYEDFLYDSVNGVFISLENGCTELYEDVEFDYQNATCVEYVFTECDTEISKSVQENQELKVQNAIEDILQCIEDEENPKPSVQSIVQAMLEVIERSYPESGILFDKYCQTRRLSNIKQPHKDNKHYSADNGSFNNLEYSIEQVKSSETNIDHKIIVRNVEDGSDPETAAQNAIKGMLELVERNSYSTKTAQINHCTESNTIEDMEYDYEDIEYYYEDICDSTFDNEYSMKNASKDNSYCGDNKDIQKMETDDGDIKFSDDDYDVITLSDSDNEDCVYEDKCGIRNKIIKNSNNRERNKIVNRGIKRQNEDLVEGSKRLRLDARDSNVLVSVMKKAINKTMLDKSTLVIHETYESFLPDVIEICLGLEVQKIRTGICKETVENLRKACEEIQVSYLKTREEFVQCKASVQSQHGLLTNGTPLHNTTAQPSTVNHNATNLPSANSGELDVIQVVNVVAQKFEPKPVLPPIGILKRKPVNIGCKVYAMRLDFLAVWSKATVTKEISEDQVLKYEVKFDRNNKKKLLTKREIAYEHCPDVQLQIGRRIIALYTPDDHSSRPAMYSGVIAEQLISTNNFRYLVFFDDGVAQYVTHNNVRLVCEESPIVHENVALGVKEFTKQYFEKYPERPMLKLQNGQVIKVLRHSEWVLAKVVSVDKSMVRVQYDRDQFEWLYRGSRRLHALNKELENAEYRKQNKILGRGRRHNISRTNQQQPYVEYTRVEIVISDSEEEQEQEVTVCNEEQPAASEGGFKRQNVARKSTARLHQPKLISSDRKLPISNHKEGLIEDIPPISCTPVTYSPHICSSSCLRMNDVHQFRGKNPLSVPMLMGFERQYIRVRKRGMYSAIWYKGPCGRLLRNLFEVTDYLFKTDSSLTIDYFSADPVLRIYRYFRTTVEETLWSSSDITESREQVPIPCVNCLTNEKPPYVEYATKPFPGEGVHRNLDKEFLCGCDCTDNCQDRLKCSCMRLTFDAYSAEGNITDLGYEHRRLKEPIVTGIYECNEQCSCNSNCVNRVVQHGLKIRLQMFRTEKKGWGIRCIDDIDAGQFICSYAGRLLTDAVADTEGKIVGDEYMAELDHIEVVERMKEGYESDVPIDLDVEGSKSNSNEADSEDVDDSSSRVSSDSPVESMQESDSDYETPAISPAQSGSSSYSTRAKSKKSDLNKKPSFLNEIDPDEKEEPRGNKVELPVIKQHEESEYKIGDPPPMSPSSEARLQSLNICRKPSFGSKHAVGVKRSGVSNMTIIPSGMPKPKQFKSIRSYFNEEDCYIMDAKTKGNIGRYLNHSCNPNSFVQSVFFECHDLRFPTVAFFASHYIKAGTELTWDYNYEVGSVPDKVMICYCGEASCRGRLL